MVKHKVGNIEARFRSVTWKLVKLPQEKSPDFLNHPEMQGLRAVKRIHSLLAREHITRQPFVEAERKSKKGTPTNDVQRGIL